MPKARPRWLVALAACAALLAIPIIATLAIDGGARRDDAVASTEAPVAVTQTSVPRVDDGARVLSGHVVDVAGDPIAGARISLSGDRRLEGSSGPDGGFRLLAVPVSEFELVVSAEGFEVTGLQVAAGSAGVHTEVEVQMQPARAVMGVVLDPDGLPLAGAIVSCADHLHRGATAADATDAEGRFDMDASTSGCTAVARHRQFADSDPTVVAGGDGNRIHMNPAAAIAGLVVDDTGQPVVAYTLAIESFKPAAAASVLSNDSFTTVVRDAEGRFEIGGLQAGRYVLAVVAPGRPPAESDAVELESGERSRGVRIVLSEGALLYGRIVDSAGDPIEGATVRLDGMTQAAGSSIEPVHSGQDGRYELPGVPTGPFSIRVTHGGYLGRVIAGIDTSGRRRLERDVELADAEEPGRTEYTGIGAMLRPGATGIVVHDVVGGGPAEAAGLAPHDVVVRIDGRDASGYTIPQAVQRLRGVPGARVSLTVLRDGEQLRIVIERERFVR